MRALGFTLNTVDFKSGSKRWCKPGEHYEKLTPELSSSEIERSRLATMVHDYVR